MVKEREEISVCSECGMNLFTTNEKTGELFCRNCRDEGIDNARIVKVLKEKSLCPNQKCRSPNTSEVEELKSNLREKYKTIVLESRNVLDDFSNFSSMLSAAKQRLLKLRSEMPVMLHEPGLEQDMLNLIDEGSSIERRIMNRIYNFFLFLRSKKPYFVDGKTWQNQDIAVLETYINQLQSDFLSFTAQVSESFGQPFEMLQTLKERIDFLMVIKEFFMKYLNKGVISLEKCEFPVINVENVKLDSDDDEHKGHGHVLVTTKSFKFVKSQGYLKKTDALLFSFPVSKLLSTDVTGRVFKRLSLQFQGISLKLNLNKSQIQVLSKYFEQLLDFEKANKLDQDKIAKIKSFDINSIFKIKTYIEENINALLNPGDIPMGNLDTAPSSMAQNKDVNYGMAGTQEFEPSAAPSRGLLYHNNAANMVASQQNQLNDIFNDISRSQANSQGFQDDFSLMGTSQQQPDYGQAPYLKHPAISTGDPRAFTQTQQAMAFSQGNMARPLQSPLLQGYPDDYSMNGNGSGNIPARIATQVQEQAMQAALSKAQDIRLLVNQLQSAEQKQVSFQETLKNLEAKFETGKISSMVYFETHQLFCQKLIELNQQIQQLRNQLNVMQYQGTRF
ncbi:MAG TPA: hypothetical protein VKM55_21045 [Candidatus Lokiarchaeia archaeon]|nr:hypothetical protein [Candidatus Lokiarchaeia archaeon]